MIGRMKNPFARPAPRPLASEHERAVVAAIQAAEKGNRGEVRVHLEQRCPQGRGAIDRTKEIFHALGMDKTRDSTGVLLYVAVDDHKTAVFAGAGIFGATEPGFWQSVSDAVASGAKRGALHEGLVDALARVGELLRKHVPGDDAAGNELPDEVTTS